MALVTEVKLKKEKLFSAQISFILTDFVYFSPSRKVNQQNMLSVMC